MTNTLHRFGAPETQRDDYIVFAMASKGINDAGAAEKLQSFLRLAVKHGPINVGHALKGGMYRPSSHLTPLAHWSRPDEPHPEAVVASVEEPSTVAAVFDDVTKVEALLRDLKAADLGVSINISSLADEANACCKRAGITRHSIEYSLGFHGDLNQLPDRHVLELSTMCGHGMLSHNFARKMIDMVRENRRTPKQAATYMARFCTCGIFNLTRAMRVLEHARKGE
jgi:hypothetical protein